MSLPSPTGFPGLPFRSRVTHQLRARPDFKGTRPITSMACYEVRLWEFMLQVVGQEISSYKRDGIGPLHTPYKALPSPICPSIEAVFCHLVPRWAILPLPVMRCGSQNVRLCRHPLLPMTNDSTC